MACASSINCLFVCLLKGGYFGALLSLRMDFWFSQSRSVEKQRKRLLEGFLCLQLLRALRCRFPAVPARSHWKWANACVSQHNTTTSLASDDYGQMPLPFLCFLWISGALKCCVFLFSFSFFSTLAAFVVGNTFKVEHNVLGHPAKV